MFPHKHFHTLTRQAFHGCCFFQKFVCFFLSDCPISATALFFPPSPLSDETWKLWAADTRCSAAVLHPAWKHCRTELTGTACGISWGVLQHASLCVSRLENDNFNQSQPPAHTHTGVHTHAHVCAPLAANATSPHTTASCFNPRSSRGLSGCSCFHLFFWSS